MGGSRASGDRSPHPLTATAAVCFTAAVGLTGLGEFGVPAVAVIEAGPTMAFVSALASDGPPTTDDAVGRGAPAGSPLPSAGPRAHSSRPARQVAPVGHLLDAPHRGAALPENAQPRSRPVGLTTSEFDLDGVPIRAVGIEADGQLEVPDETEIGWYRYGSTAGRPGATVLAAHVSWNNTTGPFFLLDTLDPGSLIEVVLDDGTTRTYEVTERTLYEKDQLPRERIWRNTGPETLVLITCGGDFNPEIGRYQHNVVVYATPTD